MYVDYNKPGVAPLEYKCSNSSCKLKQSGVKLWILLDDPDPNFFCISCVFDALLKKHGIHYLQVNERGYKVNKNFPHKVMGAYIPIVQISESIAIERYFPALITKRGSIVSPCSIKKGSEELNWWDSLPLGVGGI